MQNPEREATFIEEARRAQLVRSAIDTVNEIGYPRASLSEIAKRARVAKSAIVYYFGSKEALLLQVLDDTFTALGAVVEQAVSKESGPRQRLHAYASSYLAHVSSHRAEVAAAVAIIVAHRDADGTPLYLADTGDDTELLRHILTAGVEEGVFRDVRVSVAAKVVAALLDTAITEVQMRRDTDLAALVEEIFAFLDGGLAPPGNVTSQVAEQEGR